MPSKATLEDLSRVSSEVWQNSFQSSPKLDANTNLECRTELVRPLAERHLEVFQVMRKFSETLEVHLELVPKTSERL